MAQFIDRNDLSRYVRKGHTPNFSDPPWLRIPPQSANEAAVLSTMQTPQYRKIAGDVLSVMDAAEQAAQDATDEAAQLAQAQASAIAQFDVENALGQELRAAIGDLNKRINYVINRVEEVQDTLVAIRDQTFGTQARQNIQPSFPLATNTRARPAAIQSVKDEIAAGGGNVGAP